MHTAPLRYRWHILARVSESVYFAIPQYVEYFVTKITSLVQVVPAWPVHTNEPAQQYKPVAIPDFSLDFASYQPMEPQVRLGPLTQRLHVECPVGR